ncbi:MAG TPA: hypothetical protein VGK79_07640 [Gaiellaceae bacterium]|nr:hypothetical protein [Casimicrobiaceae bacterium]
MSSTTLHTPVAVDDAPVATNVAALHARRSDAAYPWLDRIMPGDARQFMYVVGAVEIIAGLAVLVKPRYGSWVVAAWLAGIVINLFTYSGYYDIAMRDFGLMLAALTLARLASIYDPAWRRRRRRPRR